jgi:ABC-2 type transport system permease protein
MTPFLTLLKNDIRLFLKDWKACILLLAAPLLFISYFTYVLTPLLDKSSFIEPFPVALVDLENTTQTRMLENQLREISIFSEIRRLDENAAIDQLSDKEVGGVIILPSDLTTSISLGENRPVTVVGSSAMPLQAYVVKNIVQSAANLVSAAQSAIITIYHYDREAGLSGAELDARYNNAIMEYFLEALARNEIFLNAGGDSGYSLTPVEYFTAALIVVFMMFAGMPAMKMLTMERSAGITRRLSGSPVKMWMAMLSKLIVSVLLLALQFGIIIIFTSKVFNSYWGSPVKNILMLFGAIILVVSAWSVFVASISSSPASADVIGNLGILLMAVVGGSIYPLSSMPGFMRGLSRLTINRWAMDGFMVLFSGNDAAGTGIYSLVLVMMACVLMTASILIMKFVRRE